MDFIDAKALRHFLTVVRHGSFRAAARSRLVRFGRHGGSSFAPAAVSIRSRLAEAQELVEAAAAQMRADVDVPALRAQSREVGDRGLGARQQHEGGRQADHLALRRAALAEFVRHG